MLLKQDQISPCEIELEIEVEAEKVTTAIADTYSELGKTVTVPGFRKGKAPHAILVNYLDEGRVHDRVQDRLVYEAYEEALKESGVKPFRPADVDVTQFEAGEPMLFKVKIPLPPKVELGEYTGLEVERKVPPVTEEDVEAEIKRLIEGRTELKQVTDRAAQMDDTAVVDITNETVDPEKTDRTVVKVGDNLPDFDKGIVGMQIDEEKAIEVTYPEDYGSEELAGKTGTIRTKLIELHAKDLPELTDEWVKANLVPEPKEGEEPIADPIDTVEKLRAKVRSALEMSAQHFADEQVRGQAIDKAMANAKVDYPSALIEDMIHDRVEELAENLKKRKVTIENYLEYRNETMDQLRERFAEESRHALVLSLVFREIIEKEGIKVEEDDFNAEVAAMAEDRGVPVQSMMAYIESTDDRETIENRIVRKKVVDFLVNASNIHNVG